MSFQLTATQLSRIRDFLARHVPKPIGPLRAAILSGGRSNITYKISDGSSSWVLRRRPATVTAAGEHDVLREFRVLRALAGTGVPTPRAVAACQAPGVLSVPFTVLEHLDGVVRVANDTAPRLSAEAACRLSLTVADVLARIHHVRVIGTDLAALGRPGGFLGRQLDRWEALARGQETTWPPGLETLFTLLRITCPRTHTVGLVHGDFHLGNLMFDELLPDRLVAVLDWEMATIGDPLTDVGLLAATWEGHGQAPNPVLRGASTGPGFAATAELLHHYAAASGTSLDAVDWYIVFAKVKIAVLLRQIRWREARQLGSSVVSTVSAADSSHMINEALRLVGTSQFFGRRQGSRRKGSSWSSLKTT
ncbi:MAG: phosphotransferase family protein [Actinophytocola sp.]|uniref:phosphotransferase family protein n=1 Tax=Actinophytocola sp. TaxID=1872138 RepID=UPI003C748951